jgi:hypothetical protein
MTRMRPPLAASSRALADDAPAPLAVESSKDAPLPACGVRIGRATLALALPPMVVATLAPGLMQVSAE